MRIHWNKIDLLFLDKVVVGVQSGVPGMQAGGRANHFEGDWGHQSIAG
jgi:hypothetical protein